MDVIGGGAPRGLCGSGLVDLAAVLLHLGAITPAGRLLPPEEAPAALRSRLRVDEYGGARFYLTPEVYLTAGGRARAAAGEGGDRRGDPRACRAQRHGVRRD